MKLCTDFVNQFKPVINARFFPNENHGTSLNKDYWKVKEFIELFSNRCISYGKLRIKLAKHCKTDVESIDTIADEFIIF